MKASLPALFAFMLLVLCAHPPRAAAQTPIDNIDYMSDGVMTQEEMEAEAAQVGEMCSLNAVQNQLFDCGCFSAAFLIRREKLGPLEPQSNILLKLTGDDMGRRCVNAPVVAGNALSECRRYMASYHELDRNAEPFCNCVARRMTWEFQRAPGMSPSYTASLQVRAMRWCRDPKNLAQANAPDAQSPENNAGGSTAAQTAPLLGNGPVSLR